MADFPVFFGFAAVRAAQQAAQAARTPEPLISSEAAARLREQAAGVEDKRLRESILKALEASGKPGSSKNGKSGL